MLSTVLMALGVAVVAAFLGGLVAAIWPRRAAIARKGKTSLALASLMFGFGAVIDPPTRHLIEAKEQKAEEDEPAGDPPET
jgi:hypothetical protein